METSKAPEIEIINPNVSPEIEGDDSIAYENWKAYEKAVEEGIEEAPKEIIPKKHERYEFNVDKALDCIDLTFNGYTPSRDAIEFFNIMRLVYGEDFETDNALMHYFLVDLVYGNIKRENFPYSQEINEKIRLNSKKIAIIASRFSAKSTIITAFMPIVTAITGKMPNFGDVMFWVSFGDSQQAGAKVQANTIRDICEDSLFCKDYFEKMRFTDEECEFIRKDDPKNPLPIKKRCFMFKVKGAAGGSVRGIRYKTERPQCHEVGTIIETDLGIMRVEEYPFNHGVHIEDGLEIKLFGLTESERVTKDHKYWTKKCTNDQIWSKSEKRLVKNYIEPRLGSFTA